MFSVMSVDKCSCPLLLCLYICLFFTSTPPYSVLFCFFFFVCLFLFFTFKVVWQKLKRQVFSVDIRQVNYDSARRLSVCWKEKEKTCSETVEYLSVYWNCFIDHKNNKNNAKCVTNDNKYLN